MACDLRDDAVRQHVLSMDQAHGAFSYFFTELNPPLALLDPSLHTVEHVLAAVAGAEIDDLTIEMDAPEPPIMDGSAAPFLESLSAAGLVTHAGEPAVLVLDEPVRVIDGESVYEAFPADALQLDVSIDFPHPLIGRQCGRYVVTPESFRLATRLALVELLLSGCTTAADHQYLFPRGLEDALDIQATEALFRSGRQGRR